MRAAGPKARGLPGMLRTQGKPRQTVMQRMAHAARFSGLWFTRRHVDLLRVDSSLCSG